MSAWAADDPVVQKYRALIGNLPWAAFPERPPDRPYPGPTPDPRGPFVAAFLVKLHEEKRFMSGLRAYLIDHPALVYWLGFPRVPDPEASHGFNVAATVPTRRQFSRVLRTLPNAAAQLLPADGSGLAHAQDPHTPGRPRRLRRASCAQRKGYLAHKRARAYGILRVMFGGVALCLARSSARRDRGLSASPPRSGWFQRSPGAKAGRDVCNRLHPLCVRCFNARPARRPGATSCPSR